MKINVENKLLNEIEISIKHNMDSPDIHIWPISWIGEINNYHNYSKSYVSGNKVKIYKAVPGVMYELVYNIDVDYGSGFERFDYYLTLKNDKSPLLLSGSDMKYSNENTRPPSEIVYYKIHKRVYKLVSAGLTYAEAFSTFKV